MSNRRLLTFTPWILLAALWSAMIFSLLMLELKAEKKRVFQHAEILAKANYDKDILYRRWASEHGGVYAPISETTQPNPFLKQLKERDITTPSGRKLTLLNPAYMTRQAHTLENNDSSATLGHLTSLKPLRPENAPDTWEAKALKAISTGKVDKLVEQLDINGRPYLRAIYPIFTESGCLTCHPKQDHEIGQIHGGLSVSLPLTPFLSTYQNIRATQTSVFGIVWLLGMGLLSGSINVIRKQFIRLEESKEAAELAEERYHELFNGADYGIALIDLEQEVISECNQKLAELLEKTQQELIGADQSNLPKLDNLQATLMGKEIEIIKNNGESEFLEVKKRIVTFAGKRCAELFFYDRTLEKQNERKILATAQRIHDIFQAAQNISFIIAASTEDAPIIEFSPGAEQIFGYSKQEALGKPVTMLYAPDTHIPRMQERLQSKKIAYSGRIKLVRKSGEIFPALFTLYPLFDENNELYGALGVSIDISDLKELEERLNQTQKMEAIGTLAGGIAHDFNNILSIIFGYTQLAFRQVEPDTKVFKHLQTIDSAATRAKDLVRQILTFSRKSAEKKQVLSLQPIVKEGLKMLRATLPKNISITEEISEEGGLVIADPTQMHQILMNICTNAYHAMRPDGGTIHATVKNLKIDSAMVAKHPEFTVAEYVLLQISDTGTGIDNAVLPRIFDPFFTTKITQEGTGMGLSVVHGIVQSHNGVILVDTKAGRGTCFSIYLPKAEKEAVLADNIEEPKSEGFERILLIDDEPMLAALGRDLLSEFGYKVKVSTDSRKALETFKNNPQNFDLVVTDQTMPFMAGTELTREILKIRPDLPIIICTGFSELINQKNYTEFGARKLLRKPLKKNQLAKALREILDQK